MTGVLLIDRFQLVRQALRCILERAPGIRVLAEAASEAEALRHLEEYAPDVVLKSIAGGKVDFLRRLLQAHPGLRILALLEQPLAVDAARVLEAGAQGCLCKTASPAELVAGVQTVVAGRRYLGAAVSRQLALAGVDGNAVNPLAGLSPRETEVLLLLIEGMSARVMAGRLGISEKTVNTYRHRIFAKTGVDSDVALTRLAFHCGLLAVDEREAG